MSVDIASYQKDAVNEMKNGCILCGTVGSGKSRTALLYFYEKVCNGVVPITGEDRQFEPMQKPRDLYIITTAKKRDSKEWEGEMVPFLLNDQVNITVDSWNNIKKYTDVTSAFFIFDEQRVVGSGTWVKSFLNISRKNQWILLSATPGDKWEDYIPVFIANGFFKNKTEFYKKHCVMAPYLNYRKIERYIATGILIKYRNDILVNMKPQRHTIRHNIACIVDYNRDLYNIVWKDRWNVYEDEPIAEFGKLGYVLRKVCNEDPSRSEEVKKILKEKKRAIIFYNYNYELEILKKLAEDINLKYSEWNGNKHEAIPEGDEWVYLVQYTAGAEGWNCITTDTIIFYSQNYSYRTTEQACGRIDRINTPYKDLFYYYIRSQSPIDKAIRQALNSKEKFNEKAFFQSNLPRENFCSYNREGESI